MISHFYSLIISNLIYSHLENYANALILLDQLTIDIKLKK